MKEEDQERAGGCEGWRGDRVKLGEVRHVKERRRTEQEEGKRHRQEGGRVNRGEQGVRDPPWGFDFTPAALFAAFLTYVWNLTHSSFMTSSPGVVHASVPSFHCLLLLLSLRRHSGNTRSVCVRACMCYI